MNEQVVRAAWLMPDPETWIDGGWMRVRDGRVIELGRGRPGEAHCDLGDCVVLPGLVNAHTHLEFSDAAKPIGTPGMRLPEWIGQVITRRAAQTRKPVDRVLAIQRGLEESASSGVSTLAEIATLPWLDAAHRAYGPHHWPRAPVRVVVMAELLGFSPQVQRAAQTWAEQTGAEVDDFGLSPHAPYSTPLELVRWAADQASRSEVPLAMHLAESLEERQLVERGEGPFRDLLESVGLWDARRFPVAKGIPTYLHEIARAKRGLVIHGNYLTGDEQAWLAERAHLSVVFCPRTHAYFNHAPYPLESMLDRGIRVVLGTDSRASSPDLSIWREARTVHRCFPGLPPQRVLAMVTTDAAEALGISGAGRLEVGGPAAAVRFPLQASGSSFPLQSLFDSDPVPVSLRGHEQSNQRDF